MRMEGWKIYKPLHSGKYISMEDCVTNFIYNELYPARLRGIKKLQTGECSGPTLLRTFLIVAQLLFVIRLCYIAYSLSR